MTNSTPKLPLQPTWCPGCGNFGIWGALKLAIKKLNIPQEKIVIVYDVGCSGNMADFNQLYGFHALHGRALPTAAGVKLANHDLKVIVVIGDGGCYGEGGTHFLNIMRGNHDLTVLVHDNKRYSLTTGQMSPTTVKGTQTKSTPEGAIEEQMNPIALALCNHAGFVAREFAGHLPALSDRIVQAVNHDGFSLIDVLQPCPVYNKEQDYQWYQDRIKSLAEEHDPTDQSAAITQALRVDSLPVGLFWQDSRPAYHNQVSTLKNKVLIDKDISQIDLGSLLSEYR
jgi:2-oxoglutarate/2-oxoacid ferredoxin oxidoreductase subunit beta